MGTRRNAALGAGSNVIWVDPEQDIVAVLRWINGAQTDAFPDRLVAALAPPGAAERPLAQLSNAELAETARAFQNFTATPSDTEGLAKAEVTAGGVDTRDISSKTMECRKIPGLFFLGEALDVTGRLGGFNLQWAWSSAAAAAASL